MSLRIRFWPQRLSLRIRPTFCLDYYNSCPERQESDYNTPDGEIKSEWFANFPLLRKRTRYEADVKSNIYDKESSENGCNKLFSRHPEMTCGLWILTCLCPAKRIYGVKKMFTGKG